ncbi:hypothetical protein BSKO_06832 [Bryopsis sp. KO-2023]|nr:hypothetical protein BSKO_06832 [Bryopsis sp. KO-2023]
MSAAHHRGQEFEVGGVNLLIETDIRLGSWELCSCLNPVQRRSRMGNCTQKMRCGNCQHSDEMDVALRTDIFACKNWYYHTARYRRRCPRCNKEDYAMSAYDLYGLESLRDKGASYGVDMRGAWYCTLDGGDVGMGIALSAQASGMLVLDLEVLM